MSFSRQGNQIRVLVTGGAGFIGSAVVRRAVTRGWGVINLDALAYSANLANVAEAARSEGYAFERADITDAAALDAVFAKHRPTAVMHLAAETHNDRAIEDPLAFVRANVVGTAVLLESARAYWNSMSGEGKDRFRFHHVSTDEVFGQLGDAGSFTEETPYDPSSPYSASKAGADHLVRAWGRTYGLPVVLTNCSNNYGPYQFPEKLIPTVISRVVEGRGIPIYGRGLQSRDWLHVEDHAEALLTVMTKGEVGDTYAIGGDACVRNIDLVELLCALLDKHAPGNRRHAEKITFVADRPGHDYRYAIDASKIRAKLGWSPRHELESGIEETVRWYLDNWDWVQAIRNRGFNSERLGMLAP